MNASIKVLMLAVLAVGNLMAGAPDLYTFTGLANDGGQWETPGNWTLNGSLSPTAPQTGSLVVIATGFSATLSSSASIGYPGQVSISGTLVLAPGAILNVPLVIFSQSGTISLQGGELDNADVTSSDASGSVIATNAGTQFNVLADDTIDSGVLLDITQAGGFCTVSDSMTVNGLVKIGSLDGTAAGSLFCSNSVQLKGSGMITFGANAGNAITVQGAFNTLSIGDGSFPLTINGINGTITSTGNFEGSSFTVFPNATIQSDGNAGGTITLTVSTWQIDGTVQTVDQPANLLVFNASGSGIIGPNGHFLANNGTLSVGNSVGVNGVLQIGSPNGLGTCSLLAANSLQLYGSGTITFGSSPLNAITEQFSGSSLTIGDGTGGLHINGINGTITALGSTEGSVFYVSSDATISSDSGGTITLMTGSWDIEGVVQAINQNASTLIINASGPGFFGQSNPNAELNAYSGSLAVVGTGTWQYFPAQGIAAKFGGSISLGGSWSSAFIYALPGSIFVSASTANLGGTFTATDASEIQSDNTVGVQASTFNITGVMDNLPQDNQSLPLGGLTLSSLDTFATNRQWLLVGGTINGGTIYGQQDGTVDDYTLFGTDLGGALVGVTVDGSAILEFDQAVSQVGGSPASANILSGLTVNGVVLLGDQFSSGGTSGALTWVDTQTWGGNGTITFGQATNNGIVQSSAYVNATLTIAQGLTISGGQGIIHADLGNSTLVNQGTISAGGFFESLTLSVSNWVNSGTIIANPNSFLQISASGMGSNSGFIFANGGNLSIVDYNFQPWTNFASSSGSSGILATGGSLTLGNWIDDSPGQLGISVQGGGESGNATLNITGGSATTDQLLAILANSSGISTVNIIGVLDNTGRTLDLGLGPTWNLGNTGEIISGTLTDGILYVAANNTYLKGGVVLAGDATLDLALNSNAACTVIGNITINGSVLIGGETAAELDWQVPGGFDSATWGGSGTIAFGNPDSSINDRSSTNNEVQQILNFGDGDGGLSISSGSGTIGTNSGDALFISSDVLISSSLNSTITFSGGYNLENVGSISTTGGTIVFSGMRYLNNDTGATIAGSGTGSTVTFNAIGTQIYNQGAISATAGAVINGTSASAELRNLGSGTVTAGLAGDPTGSTIALTLGAMNNYTTIATDAGSAITFTVSDWSNNGSMTSVNASDALAILASDGGSNQGTITASGSLVISGGSWTNYATITANQAQVFLGGSWNNNQNSDGISGSMVDNASNFYLGGFFHADEFAYITVNSTSPGDCIFHLVGTMDGVAEDNPQTGGVLDLSLLTTSEPSNPPVWRLDGGTLSSVTVTDSSNNGLALPVTTDGPPPQLGSPNLTPYGDNPATLDGAVIGQNINDTVLLDLASFNGATCLVVNGLTVNSSIQIGAPVNIPDSSTGTLVWIGIQTWGGVGAIDFGAMPSNAIADGNGVNADQVLTVGTQLTINAGTGTIAATSPGAQLIDNGIITSLSGSVIDGLVPNSGSALTFALGGGNSFIVGATGTLTIAPGTGIVVDGDYQQSGTLNVSIGNPNSPPAVPSTSTLDALDVTAFADISAGSIIINAAPGYPPEGGATNALFTVVTASDGVSTLFTGSSGIGIPGNYQLVEDASSKVVSVQIAQPTVAIALSAGQSASTNLAPISFTVSASEAIYFPEGIADLVVSGGTITSSVPTDSGSALATITVTVVPAGPGNVTLSIPAGNAFDAFGLASLASNAVGVYFDNSPVLATITPNGTSTNSGSIQFTITVSKPLSGPPTVGTSGGTPTVVTNLGNPLVYQATTTATGSGSPATPVTVTLAPGGALDVLGNTLAAAVSATVTYDTVAPTVVITPNGTITNAVIIPFTLTFSKPVALTAAGLASSGTLGALSGGPTVWTVPVTAGPGTVSLTVLAPPTQNVAVDLAGNPLAGAVSASVTKDTTAPLLVSFTPSGIATNASPIPFTITFTKAVTLDPAQVTVTNGTLTAISPGPAASYTLEVTPSAGTPPVAVTVAVAGAAVVDLAGNAMAAPATTTVNFDNRLLTAVISPSGSATSVSPIVFTITFSSPLTSPLVSGNLLVTNGTAGTVAAVSTTVYTVPVTPTVNGGVFLEIPYGVVTDTAGNPNQSAIAAVTSNSGNPTVTVTPASGQVSVVPVVFTLTFSAPVSNLTTGGLVSNGTIGQLSGSGAIYTVPVTPSGFGSVTLQVSAGAAIDTNSLPNTTSNLASVTYAVVTASTPVTVTVVPPAATTNQSPLVFTLTFSVPVSGLVIGDLVVTNGTASNLQGNGALYTVDVTPNGDGPVSVAVLPNVATDSAGTGNLASPPATVVYHATPPSAVLTFAAGVPVTVASFPLNISFSEPVTGFTIGGLSISNGAASAFTVIDAATYSVTITPTTPVTASVIATIPAASCQDAFGNANPAATITIPMQSGTVSSGVVTPAIALSPANATVFTAICPGTLSGLAQVQSFLTSASPAQARAFVWDATLQDFVPVPAQSPTGGWQPFQGVFLASRLPTNFNFNGFMTTFDFTLTLKPGWNFVGIPPLDDSGTAVTTHQWSDLQLEDTAGNIITGAERSNLIDIGAWGWNGSAYTQVSGTLSTGQGYWIDNASSPGVDLVLRRLSPSELSAQLGAFRPSLSGHGVQASQGSQAGAATIGYTAHSTPPQPPTGSGQGESSGHGCGLGSGVGALILGFALLLRLRLRSRR